MKNLLKLAIVVIAIKYFYLCDRLNEVDWNRFIEDNYLDASSSVINYTNGIEKYPNLYYVMLKYNYIRTLDNTFENLTKLYYLDLTDNLIDEIQKLRGPISLKYLFISLNSIIIFNNN
jgi:Leucine-rich repeat (LRR) protein